MRRIGLAIVLSLTGGMLGAAALSADTDEVPVFMTGAEPISHDDYNRLPKLGKFRAWLPKKVDLSAIFPLPGNQGGQPNCVAWATTYAARSFLNGKNLGHQPVVPAEQLSPAYVYNRLRPPGSACSSTIRIVDALNLLQTEGVVSLADFPDDMRNCPMPAPRSLQEKASAFKLASWRAIDREIPGDWQTPVVLDDIKGALARQEPVVFAMPIAKDWFALRGDAVYAHARPETANFHAMALVGYDEDKQAFRVINSWGQNWGDHGYAWIGYDTFKLLVAEAYAMEAPSGPAPAASVATAQQRFDALAAKLPCGAITVSRPGGRLTVSGFGGGQDSVTELKYAALALDPRVDWKVSVNAWPQCEAQLTLAGALATGVGQMALSMQSDTGQRIAGEPIQLHAGDKFGIVAEIMPVRPYLSVVYLQADGSAVELYRGAPAPGPDRRRIVNIGAGGTKEVRFQVGPPYGNESVIAIASAQPLFGPELEDYATERQFLTGLRAKLASAPKGSVSAMVMRIRSKE